MIEDIKTQIEYIKAKINKENLSGHSFYFYVIPFNDADCDKVTIMQNLLGEIHEFRFFYILRLRDLMSI